MTHPGTHTFRKQIWEGLIFCGPGNGVPLLVPFFFCLRRCCRCSWKMFVEELDKSQEGVKQNKINMSNDGFAKTTNNSKIDQLYIFFWGFVNDVLMIPQHFLSRKMKLKVLLGSWIRMEKNPQHSPRQTKEILCMKDPPPGLPDSVSSTWHLLRPKPGRVLFKNEDFRMVWRLPTSGNPYRSLINMVEFWGMIFFGMLGTFFLLSTKMACRWQMSSIDWYQRFCEPLIIMLCCHICQSRISTCHEDVTRFVVVLQETSQGCQSLQHLCSGDKVVLRHFMFWCSRCPCVIRKWHTWFKSTKFTLPESGLQNFQLVPSIYIWVHFEKRHLKKLRCQWKI